MSGVCWALEFFSNFKRCADSGFKARRKSDAARGFGRTGEFHLMYDSVSSGMRWSPHKKRPGKTHCSRPLYTVSDLGKSAVSSAVRNTIWREEEPLGSYLAEIRATLRRLGYNSTLQYLEAMCELVLRESTLLPHPNPGLMSAQWVRRLAAVSPSMGLMLETTSDALLRPGAAHDNAPDKVPVKRLHTIEEAGKLNVPFTTGLRIGI